MSKSVLDATTGGKHMWHSDSKESDRVMFVDRRSVENGGIEHQPGWSCEPDVKADIRNLPFKDGQFDLVTFDPPHRVTKDGMERLTGIIEKKYGALKAQTLEGDLESCFRELWRVLRSGGTLTLKWADTSVSHDHMLSMIPETPMYGAMTEKDRAVVKWWVFHKGVDSDE